MLPMLAASHARSRQLEAVAGRPHIGAESTSRPEGAFRMNDTGMSTAPSYQQIDAPLRVTDSAVGKVRQLIAEEGNPDLKLRVYITGGGCSGFQYGFTFDEEQAEDDYALAAEDVTVVVDPLSLQYLMGAEVDYAESLSGAQFVIRNPNARTTCGCGSSFTV